MQPQCYYTNRQAIEQLVGSILHRVSPFYCVDNLRFRSDTEVNQLLTHNAPLTLYVLFKNKTWDQNRINNIYLNTFICSRFSLLACTFIGTLHLCRYSKSLSLQHFIKGYGIDINFDKFHF